MAHERHENHEAPQWARAKSIRESRGLTAPQLARYAEEGLIRTSHIRRPGQTRGVRLFHLGDIDQLIMSSIDQRPMKPTRGAHTDDTPENESVCTEEEATDP